MVTPNQVPLSRNFSPVQYRGHITDFVPLAMPESSRRCTMLSYRVHIVLVPGFGGFDALGQLQYYAGITPLFQSWKKGRRRDDREIALHYFDNLPTAGVVTR